MAKYYVSSGNFQLVVSADDARGAAIWGVHRCLAPLVPHLSEQEECEDVAQAEAGQPQEATVVYRRLGETIRVSERGFESADSVELPTLSVVAEWSRLLLAIERLCAEIT